MRKNKNHAFTLVELLIVIVVIGILSAMMMLSSTEAVTSAKVAKIISNLKNLKTAALAFYADNIDECQNYDDASLADRDVRARIFKYLGGNEIDRADAQYYNFYNFKSGGRWYVHYGLNNDNAGTVMPPKVREKLASRANSLNLLNGDSSYGAPDPANNKGASSGAARGGADQIYDNVSHKWYVGMRIK